MFKHSAHICFINVVFCFIVSIILSIEHSSYGPLYGTAVYICVPLLIIGFACLFFYKRNILSFKELGS